MLTRYILSLGVFVLSLSYTAHAERWICKAPCAPGNNISISHGKNLPEAWSFFVAKCNKKGIPNVHEVLKKNCNIEVEPDENIEETVRPTRSPIQSAS